MECIEAALKTSIRKEMALKSIPQEFLEEFLWAGNVQNGAPCDDFSVDELLDLSNQEGFIIEEEEEEEEVEKTCTVSVALKREAWLDDKNSDGCSDFSVKDDFVSAGELGVPEEDMASLEWLSHFVEDSNSEYSAPFPAGIFPEEKPKAETISEPEKLVLKEACFKTLVPAKARSKRTRTGVRVWPFGSPSVTESPSGSATSSSSSSSSPSSPRLLCTNPGMAPDPADPVYFEKPPAKKQKKKPALQAGSSGGGGTAPQPRRCSHCGVQKTPQWRAGPLGAKTLCNACGVRFKSGRLLPEYRPAGSPTFSSKLHSNHHRKVLEMRREKEMLGQAEPGSASPAVTGF